MSRTIPRHCAVYLLVALVLAPMAGGCRTRPQRPFVRLTPANEEIRAVPVAARSKVLRVAVAPILSCEETFHGYAELAGYLARRLRRQWELVQRGTYAEVNDLVRWRECDVALVCSYAYLVGQREFGMQAIAVPQAHGKPVYYSYLIVPRDSPARSMRDLRGKVFAFTDPLSNTGRLSPTSLLQQMGETPSRFFQKCVFTYGHDKSVRAVAEKWVDGAAVDSLIYEYLAQRRPEVTKKTRVIVRSEPYGMPPVVVHPATDAYLKRRIQQLLLHLHESEEGRRILSDLVLERFLLPDDRLYDSLRRMVAQMEGVP